jgi:dsRNA-specific ribonuclease
VPVFSFIEVETENEKMRFIATLSLNKFDVGKGYGANKKSAKMSAARMALQSLVPNVYFDWV